jgi:phosphoglycolate phosphatase
LVASILRHRVRALLFDLDGTLVDTAGEIAAALARTFAELGLPALPNGAVEALIGRGVASMVERALVQVGATGTDIARAVARFETHYEATVATVAELYPGVAAGLALLQGEGLPMAVVTNKPRHFTERLLDRLHSTASFAAVVAGDDGLARKPSGEMLLAACARLGSAPAATLMVGDSGNDVAAARAAGCPVWCVPYGYNEGRPAETLACDRIVADLAEVARLLRTPSG